MKAGDYISFYSNQYNLLGEFPVQLYETTVAGFIENNPEHELDDIELDRILNNETYSLSKFLEMFRDERELVSILRQLFDDYRTAGGNPMDWLDFTFEAVSTNPQNFKAEHRGVLEKNLLLWIENFSHLQYEVPSKEYNHRHYAIAEWYKWTVGLIEKPTVKQLHAQGGKAREKAFNSLNKKSPTYRPKKTDELKKAIEILKDLPPARQKAESDLINLEKS